MPWATYTGVSAMAVERVSERPQTGDDGKPLVFRDSMISNIRELVDVVQRSTIAVSYGLHWKICLVAAAELPT